METELKRLLSCLVAACTISACGPSEEPAAADADADAIVESDTTSPDSAPAVAEPAVLPSASIYYTLTDYGWYAEGRPLMHEGRGHMPAGAPIHAGAGEMTKAGEYEGVEYYTRAAADGSVYVPVYEGYWQQFSPEGD